MFNLCRFEMQQQTASGTEWVWLNADRPKTARSTLDLSLDTASVKITDSDVETAYKPFTLCRFVAWESEVWDINNVPDNARKWYWVVSSDSVELMNFGAKRYTHSIQLVELTKLAEGVTCDNLTFTTPLIKNYVTLSQKNAKPVTGSDFYPEIVFLLESGIYVPKVIYFSDQTYTLLPPQKLLPIKPDLPLEWTYTDKDIIPQGNYPDQMPNPQITITKPDGTTDTLLYYDKGTSFETYQDLPDFKPYQFTQTGTHKIQYSISAVDRAGTAATNIITYYVTSVNLTNAPKPKSVYDCLDRLIRVYNTPISGKAPAWVLSPDLDFLKNVPAPEFRLTRGTLFENLLIVLLYANGIPRIEYDESTGKANVINATFLGGSNAWRGTAGGLQTKGSSYAGEEYFSAIDGYAQNVSVSNGSSQLGTVRAPYRGFSQTEGKAVTSLEARITSDNAIIKLPTPAQIVTKLVCILPSGQRVDVTEFLFESKEYEILSNFSGTPVVSKQYAIRWTFNGDVIDGLSFKAEELLPIAETYAIQSILALLGYTLSDADIPKLAFYVEYIPFVAARYVQKKPYARYVGGKLDESPMTKIYNQNESVVDAIALGENMRGVVARIGNEVKTRTFYCSLNDIPTPGELFEGDYIGIVDWEIDAKQCRVTVTTSPDFNMWSEYLALNSQFRLFDVSERQAIERRSNWSTYVWIGLRGDALPNVEVPTAWSIRPGNWLSGTLQPSQSVTDPITFANITGYEKDGTKIQTLTLPVASFAIGTSIAMSIVGIEDNFGAGSRSALQGGKYIAQHVPYANDYGEIDELEAQFCANGVPQSNTAFDLPAIYLSADGALLPERHQMQKDSSEIMLITKQIHFRTVRKEIVIGNQITRANALIRDLNGIPDAVAVFVSEPVNQFAQTVDGDSGSITVSEEFTGNTVSVSFPVPQKDYAGVAVINPNTKELYFGVNVKIVSGQRPQDVIFKFK